MGENYLQIMLPNRTAAHPCLPLKTSQSPFPPHQ